MALWLQLVVAVLEQTVINVVLGAKITPIGLEMTLYSNFGIKNYESCVRLTLHLLPLAVTQQTVINFVLDGTCNRYKLSENASLLG